MIMMKLAPMLSNMSVGIIGGADGPTAVFVTSSPGGIVSTVLLIAGAVCFAVAIVKLFRKRKK
jgi:Na+-transporting methylmalonyl-CoA/oxaloacetate decarboxylase beta subunit